MNKLLNMTQFSLSWWDTGIILIPLFLYLILGLRKFPKISTLEQFFVAERRLGIGGYVAAFVSTNISVATVILALAALGYTQGISTVWLLISWFCGIGLFYFIVPKLTSFFKTGHSIHEFLEERYNSRSTRIIASLTTLIFFWGTFGIEILAITLVFKWLGASLFPPSIIAISSALVVVIYVALSGFQGVVDTDYWQLVFIIISFGIVALYMLSGLFLGIGPVSQSINVPSNLWTDMFLPGKQWIIAAFVLLVPFQISVMDMWQRCVAIGGDTKKIRRGLKFSSFFFLLWLVPIIIGIISRGLFPSIQKPQDAGLHFLSLIRTPLIVGVVYAGLIGTALSTADTLLFNATYTFFYDIYVPWRSIDLSSSTGDMQKKLLKLNRALIVFLGLTGAIIPLTGMWNLYELILSWFSAQIVLFWPIIFAIFFPNKMRKKGVCAFWSILLGLILAVTFAIYGAINKQKSVLDSSPIIGFFGSLVIFAVLYIVSKKTKTQ